jgi:integrase/recombinase XerD
MRHTNDLPVLVERWFTDRLMKHRGVSSNTIASYRDTFRLLFAFAQTRIGRSPSQLTLRDLDAPFIGAFLEDLETTRAPSVRTRNLRLTAILSFFRYAAFGEPAHSAHIQRAARSPASDATSGSFSF